ncbi:MAG: 3-isopropylmalate dehydratase small subunit [Desulfobulbaceae bacterium]|jgi:3-isopropylmalate/(R)-2-methylmalate dehydratase small subunit|nr:3-isopropylmalate dehydratase small subunit [Desulfobulbaceae bacterium]
MKTFGGQAIFLDRSDINTDEIIPAKYLTEITKTALKPHLLEDLLLDGQAFDAHSQAMQEATVVVSRANFGCGSSREHAVWAFEVNNINLIIAEGFARIFRQNMFNCGILAITLEKAHIDALFALAQKGAVTVSVDLTAGRLKATSGDAAYECAFPLNDFDRELVGAGGWLTYADQRY